LQSGQQNGQQSGQQNTTIEKQQSKVLKFCVEPKSSNEIKVFLDIKSRQYISSKIINPLIRSGKLEYVNKNSVNARNQKYITVKIDK